MAAPTYGTDLTLIDECEDVGTFVATGGGASALNDETDYFINNTQCVSKNGFTADEKGMMHDDVSAPTITSGDCVFIWLRQANRNLLDTVANGGGQVIMGTSNNNFDQFYVDGNDVEGSDLLSWVNYAVDPTATPSATTGSPGSYDHFGGQWVTLGSGSLKGAPQAVDVIRHGRELTCIDGDLGNGYATFDGAASFDAATARRWGILTPVTGGYQFHGAFVMGTTGTSVDFRDSDRSIVVLDDVFAPAAFNEFEIRNASSNVEWTNIIIQHLGTTSPSTMTLDVGTFTGDICQFNDCGTTTFNTDGTSSCTDSSWTTCDRINLNEADISGSSILTSAVVADEGAVFDDRATTGATSISELDNCSFSQGATAHHAIRFGTGVDENITLTGIEFTGFSSSDDVNGSTLRFDATSGSINCNLVDCTVDGSPATTANVGVDDAAGITVTLVVDPVATKVTVEEPDGTMIQNARVLLETSDDGGGSGFPYQASISTLTQSAGTATLTASAAHGLATNDYVVIRRAEPEGYNGVVQITVTSTTAFTYTVDSGLSSPATNLGTPGYIDAQDETDYDNTGNNGTFNGGSLHLISDVITLDSGIDVTVDAVLLTAVTEFTVDNSGQTSTVNPGDTDNQASTTGSGVSFSLTPQSNNVLSGLAYFSYVAVTGLTDVNGEITSSKTWPASQGLSGWARKSSASPYFRQAAISIADGSGGTDLLVALQPDD